MPEQLESSIPAEQQEQSTNPGQLEQTGQALEMESTNPELDDTLGNVADAAIDQKALVKNVADDFASLQRALIERLFKRWTEQTFRLRSEAETKMQESAELRHRHAALQPRAEARMRVLGYEIDKAIAEGRDSEVGEMRGETIRLTENLSGILQEADACDGRVWELGKMQRQQARELFEEAFPEIRAALVEVQRGMCGLLDGVWDDLLRYQSEAGLEGSSASSGQRYQRSLLTPGHKADLTARDRGEEGELFWQLLQWFGVRR